MTLSRLSDICLRCNEPRFTIYSSISTLLPQGVVPLYPVLLTCLNSHFSRYLHCKKLPWRMGNTGRGGYSLKLSVLKWFHRFMCLSERKSDWKSFKIMMKNCFEIIYCWKEAWKILPSSSFHFISFPFLRFFFFYILFRTERYVMRIRSVMWMVIGVEIVQPKARDVWRVINEVYRRWQAVAVQYHAVTTRSSPGVSM